MSNIAAPKILVIDDEPSVCELINDILSSEGIDVVTASNAAQAEQYIRSEGDSIDMAIADLGLPDSQGCEIVSRIKNCSDELSTIIITGSGQLDYAAEACRNGCADFLTKPINIDALKKAVSREIDRKHNSEGKHQRELRLRELVHKLNKDRHRIQSRLSTTCEALTKAYRTLNKQFIRQESALKIHRNLIGSHNDDDIFRVLFSTLGERMGDIFGMAMVCDENAELQMVGRFGTPAPDSISICQGFAMSLLDIILQEPHVMRLNPQDHRTLFPQWLHPHTDGVQFLCLPLIPQEGQLIGMVVLYHKNNQEFTDDDLSLATMLAPSIAVAVQNVGEQEV